MVDFSKPDKIERWFEAIEPGRRREVAVALTARAALRETPLLESELHRRGQPVLSDYVLPCLRATAVAWAASRYPAYLDDLRAPATDAYAAASAAFNATPDGKTEALNAAMAAALIGGRISPHADPGILSDAIIGLDAHVAAAAADATWIDAGLSIAELAGRPLWPNEVPRRDNEVPRRDWASELWRSLKSALLRRRRGLGSLDRLVRRAARRGRRASAERRARNRPREDTGRVSGSKARRS